MSSLLPSEDLYRTDRKYINNDLDINYYIRVAMVGDAGVGKTTLLLRYTENANGGRTSPEHTVDMRTKMILRNGHRIKLEVQDTAGLERYRSLTRTHYNSIMGALLVFDLTNEQSFKHMTYWHEELKRHTNRPIQVLLIGTHCHKKDDREVTDDSAKRLADHLDIEYVEVSAEKNTNVELCFEKLVDKIMDRYAEKVKVAAKERIAIDNKSESSSSYGCC